MARDVDVRHGNAARQPSASPTTTPELGVIEGGLDFASRAARFLGTTLLVAFVIGLIGALILHATMIETQQDLDARRAEVTRLLAETETLRSELAELEAPARIVEDARDQGMIEAPTLVYLATPPGELDERTLTVATNLLWINE